jgi:hypothetical protein
VLLIDLFMSNPSGMAIRKINCVSQILLDKLDNREFRAKYQQAVTGEMISG